MTVELGAEEPKGFWARARQRLARKPKAGFTPLEEAGLTWAHGIDHRDRIDAITKGRLDVRDLLKEENYEEAMDVVDSTLAESAWPWGTAFDNTDVARLIRYWYTLYRRHLDRRSAYGIREIQEKVRLINKGVKEAETGEPVALTLDEQLRFERYNRWCKLYASLGFYALTLCFQKIHVGPQKVIVIQGLPMDRYGMPHAIDESRKWRTDLGKQFLAQRERDQRG